MNSLTFTPVIYSDLSVLKEIYNYYVLNSTATFHIEPITDSHMESILFNSDSLYESYCIKDNDINIGYILLCPYSNREAYRRCAEITIYLKTNYSGQGIGSRAISFIEDIAKKKGIKTLLSVICGENISSIKLFEKNKYDKCGHLKNVGEKFGRILDIVIYQKEL